LLWKKSFLFLSPGVKFKFVYAYSANWNAKWFDSQPISYQCQEPKNRTTEQPNNQTTDESKNQRTEEPNSTEREKNDRCFGVNAVAPYASDLVFGFGAGLGIHGGVGVAIPLVLVNLEWQNGAGMCYPEEKRNDSLDPKYVLALSRPISWPNKHNNVFIFFFFSHFLLATLRNFRFVESFCLDRTWLGKSDSDSDSESHSDSVSETQSALSLEHPRSLSARFHFVLSTFYFIH